MFIFLLNEIQFLISKIHKNILLIFVNDPKYGIIKILWKY